MSNDIVVSMQDIHKKFLGTEIETHALQGVSLNIYKGEFVAITGPSGCGKSTLLTIMGLLDSASDGNYFISDIETRGLNVDQRTQVRNQHIGYVFQSFNLIDSMTVFENVALPLEHRGEKSQAIKNAVIDALEKVGMQHRTNYKPNQISGGQQQRVAIARALVGNPDLILVDEPTGNLDTKNGDAVMKLLMDLNKQGSTIVMVTHDTRYSALADRQIQLLDGKVVGEKQVRSNDEKEVA
ncbi:ABC transporter ATP-binding protein [Alteromonas sediminis]|uniref:ABC transporter ATP-binding protein n=1 Tax=Alteromonas sediminis TaxID=2259342 RepID=A0A3N5XXQ6_9ALTE|nr:ABC transporter ATP-binding protein [Alteromonas sediminis]RPJ65827.1 ABC transporter ATP-binding protein [Alteromonas sediminis]